MKLAAALLVAAALLAGGARADMPAVIVTADRVPMAYVENGKLSGLLVDLTQEAFRRIGRPLEIRLLPWPRCVAEVRTGEADATTTMFRTPEREGQFAFGQEDVLQQTESLFVKKDNPQSFDGNLAVLAGKRIGVIYQTSYGPRLDHALAGGLFGPVSTERSMADLVRMLAHGRIDLLPGDRGRILGAAASAGLLDKIRELRPPVEVTPGYIAFTKARDMTPLLQAFDQAIRAMKADGSYAAILSKYPNP